MNEPRIKSDVSDAIGAISSPEAPEALETKSDDNTGNPNTARHALRKLLLSRRWLIIPPIAIGVFVVYLMVSAQKELPRDEVPEQTIKATVISAQRETIQTKVVGFGTALPSRTWSAIAEVSGRIDWIHPSFESGNWVTEGEELVKIDNRDYELRLAQRRADLNAAKASLDELHANQQADEKSLQIEVDLLEVTKKDIERVRRLRNQNAVSISEVETVEGNHLRQIQSVQQRKNSLSLYPSRIASAEAKVALAESAVLESQRDVERTVIASPLNGVLVAADLEIGQVVSPNQQLFQIQDNHRLEIEAQISLSQLGQLLASENETGINLTKAAQSLREVEAIAINESGTRRYQWKGKPLRLTESLDVQTRTIGVVVEVVNKSDDENRTLGNEKPSSMIPLKAGTYCEVHLFGPTKENVVALPRTSFDNEYVYVVDDEGRLRSRKVVRGDSVGERIIVVSGIDSGDRVVERPPIPAIEGMKVRQQ